MSLPTNTWIEVERADELPHDELFIDLSITVDVADEFYREPNKCYNFWMKTFNSLSFTPTHFMIIELPK